MLDSNRLIGKLREFCDSSAPAFRGFPTTRDQARSEWAAAFADYFDQIQEDVSPPVPGHPALLMTTVEQKFFTDLGLVSSVSASDTAEDFTGAWEKGVLAVMAGAGVNEGSNLYKFVMFNNVTLRRGALLTNLTHLFASPSASTTSRLTEIANAFHDATSGLTADITIITPSGSSLGTLAFK